VEQKKERREVIPEQDHHFGAPFLAITTNVRVLSSIPIVANTVITNGGGVNPVGKLATGSDEKSNGLHALT
jgi:hypothetical protein